MDFTPEELEKASAIWNYAEASEVVYGCEELLHKSDNLNFCSTFTRIIKKSYSKAIITTKEVLTLLYNGYPEGSMALSRILYESMIIMRFLYIHRDDEELLQRYCDDYAVKISLDRVKYYNYLLEYSQSEEEKEKARKFKIEARKEHNKLKEKYAQYLSYNKQSSYLHDYWWVGDVIKNKSFGGLQSEVTLDNLRILYILSCYRAHSGTVGNNIRFGTVFDEKSLSTTGSLDGFEIPLCFSLVCFGILTETMFDSINTECGFLVEKIEKIIAPFENCLYR